MSHRRVAKSVNSPVIAAYLSIPDPGVIFIGMQTDVNDTEPRVCLLRSLLCFSKACFFSLLASGIGLAGPVTSSSTVHCLDSYSTDKKSRLKEIMCFPRVDLM